MAYNKTNWQDNVTPISALNMNKIEQGIADAHTSIDAATNAATPNTLVKRDPAGRFKAAAPSASDDVARKAETDAAYNRGVTAEQNAKDYAVNKIAVYGGGTPIDPNTTTDAYILTNHANVPTGSGYWHIHTFFYSSVTGNRAQMAQQYTGDELYIRHYQSSYGWTSWKQMWGSNNHNNTGDPHTQYVKKAGDKLSGNIDLDNNQLLNVNRINFTNGSRVGEEAGNRFLINAENNRFHVVTEDGQNFILVANYDTDLFQFKGRTVWTSQNLDPNQIGRANMIPIYTGPFGLYNIAVDPGNRTFSYEIGTQVSSGDFAQFRFLWSSAISAGRSVYFEVIAALSGTGTGYFALRDGSNNRYGEISTTSTGPARIRSSAITLPNNTELYPSMWGNGVRINLYSARIVII